VDFDALRVSDVWPAFLKLGLHVSPDLPRLVIQPVHLNFSRLFELIESEFSLNNGGFDHQPLELGEGRIGFVAAPSSLDFNGSENWTVWALVFVLRVRYGLVNLHSVRDTAEDVL